MRSHVLSARFSEKINLSKTLFHILNTLRNSPLQVNAKDLAEDIGVNEKLLSRMKRAWQNPNSVPLVTEPMFHHVLREIESRYPNMVVKVFKNGSVGVFLHLGSYKKPDKK